ncbi:MAG: sigma-70 family RNA polymerase sigma factor [Candidatus Omnitrophota bacterium]|jgi:RNA polymerase sigma-70 factor (ECF subfamily)
MPPRVKADSIYDKYKNKVYHLALGMARNEKDAEDIAQNAFIKIIKNLDKFRNESNISTWIYKITYNESLMFLRKKYRQFRLSNELAQFPKGSSKGLFINWSKLPSEELLDKEFKVRADSIIQGMPIKYRMPLLLHHAESLAIKDAAPILGLKADSFKTRLHRSYLMFKDGISGYFKDNPEKHKSEDPRCYAWSGFVRDYASGSLGKNRYSAFDRHIKDCPGCKVFLDTYKQAIRITGAMQCMDLPAELKIKIETFLSPRHLNNENKRGWAR